MSKNLKYFLNKEEYDTSEYTLYDSLRKLCDDPQFYNKVFKKVKGYSKNINEYAYGDHLKQYKFDYFVNTLKEYLDRIKERKTLFKKFKETGAFKKNKKKINKFKNIMKKKKTKNRLDKICRMIDKLKIKPKLKETLISILYDDGIYRLNMTVKHYGFITDMKNIILSQWVSIESFGLQKYIFSTIISKSSIERLRLHGVLATFILNLNWSILNNPIKSLKEITIINIAEKINKLGFSQEGNDLLKCIPIDIMENSIFKRNLSKPIQMSLFNEYDSTEFIDKYEVYKTESNQIKKKLESRHFYIIIDNVYYFTKITYFTKNKYLKYNDSLDVLSLENYLDSDSDN